MRNAGAQITRRSAKTMGKIISSFPATANDETPGCKLRELADDYESGAVRGVIVTYVTDDGEVMYKLMGALSEEENLGNAVTIVGELKRRINMMIALSS